MFMCLSLFLQDMCWAQFRQTFILLLLTSQPKYALNIFQRQSFSRSFNWHYRQKLSVITLHCIYWANNTSFWNRKDGHFFPMKISFRIVLLSYNYLCLPLCVFINVHHRMVQFVDEGNTVLWMDLIIKQARVQILPLNNTFKTWIYIWI